MIQQFLHDNWLLRPVGNLDAVPATIREVDAVVPGCVHLDLLRENLIPDPYLDRNETLVQWIGTTDWQYQSTLSVDAALLAHDRVELVCEGLDTVATLELNGIEIGRASNMHHPHRFDVRGALQAGENTLRITFDSAVHHIEKMEQQLGELPHVGNGLNAPYPFNTIRKMACNFGWDWGPVLVTAGIWKPIYLQAWNEARLSSVRPLIMRAQSDGAMVVVMLDLDRVGQTPLKAQATVTAPSGERIEQDIKIAAGETTAKLAFAIDNPQLWWPRGYGAQPLYDLKVLLSDSNQSTLDEWSGRIGLREVKLDTAPDDIGSPLTISVNGQAVFCKGANWIPDDCFVARIDAARYRERIEQAVAANMNMLRIWGGGLYEADAFYDVCDELGVLVWQDFLFACAMYSEEEPIRSQVETEARFNIARLSKHPSLVLWNGCNENIWGYHIWGWKGVKWKEFVEGRTWGAGYYLELLPDLVAELDPTRPYWPASPYSGAMEIFPNEEPHGNMHIWTGAHSGGYRAFTPRFCSEFGHQAPPNWATLARAIPEDQRQPESEAMNQHQKADGGTEGRVRRPMLDVFDEPANFDDWHYLAQLNQACSIGIAVEYWRSQWPACAGSLYWQLNDCWPVTSWAAIDSGPISGDARPKPLWFATRRFYAPRLLTIQPEGETLVLYALNDSNDEWRDKVLCSLQGFAGGVVAQNEMSFVAAPHSAHRVGKIGREIALSNRPECEFIVAQSAGEERALWFFDADKNLEYPTPQFEAEVARDGDTQRLTITAKVLLRDVCLGADRLDASARVSEQIVTLLPGESFTWKIESSRELTREALTGPPVFQCANRFGKDAS